jgi:hypothetical protein
LRVVVYESLNIKVEAHRPRPHAGSKRGKSNN